MKADTEITVSGEVKVKDQFGNPVKSAQVRGRLVSGKSTAPVEGATDESGLFKIEQVFVVAADTFQLEVTEVVGFDGGPWQSIVSKLPRVANVEIGALTYKD